MKRSLYVCVLSLFLLSCAGSSQTENPADVREGIHPYRFSCMDGVCMDFFTSTHQKAEKVRAYFVNKQECPELPGSFDRPEQSARCKGQGDVVAVCEILRYNPAGDWDAGISLNMYHYKLPSGRSHPSDFIDTLRKGCVSAPLKGVWKYNEGT